MKEILNNPDQVESLASELELLVESMALGDKVKIQAVTARSGTRQISISGKNDIRLAQGAGLEKLLEDENVVINHVASAIGKTEKSMTATDILRREEFANACITELNGRNNIEPSKLFETFSKDEAVPIFYGSTSGINPSEILETLVCAKTSSEILGMPTCVLFDFSGASSEKANAILRDSITALVPTLRAEAIDFANNLGRSGREQQLNAALLLFGSDNIAFADSDSIFQALGSRFTVGKLLVLARLAGEDPVVFKGTRASALLRSTMNRQEARNLLKRAVADVNLAPAGFTFYARQAVIATDIGGSFIQPFKLTDKANIYKILGSYRSLISQNQNRGVILCPITRQRIQTPSQIDNEVGDPIDIRVLAYLATASPQGFADLRNSFSDICRVLNPREAQEQGTADNRISISQFFEGVI